MKLGKYLGYLLLLGLLIWGLLDVAAWVFGWQTLSQYVIIRSNESGAYALSMLFLITGGSGLLIWHWELIPILSRKFKRLKSLEGRKNISDN